MEGLGAKCCSALFCSSRLGKHRALSLPSSTLEYLLEKSFLLPTRPHLHLLIYRYLYSNPTSVWSLPSILPIGAPAAPPLLSTTLLSHRVHLPLLLRVQFLSRASLFPITPSTFLSRLQYSSRARSIFISASIPLPRYTMSLHRQHPHQQHPPMASNLLGCHPWRPPTLVPPTLSYRSR